MAEIKKYILKDAQGNTLYVQTLAGLVVTEDGSNVQAKLDALQNATAGKAVTYVKENIAARDALTGLNTGDQCWVRDATGDTSVSRGAAKYIYDGTSWIKTSEAESMDIVHDWKDIQNKPSSSVSDIDDAVLKKHQHTSTVAEIDAAVDTVEEKAASWDAAASNAHTHGNKELLDGISADGETVTINGKVFYAKQEVVFIGAGGTIPATLASNGLVFEAIA